MRSIMVIVAVVAGLSTAVRPTSADDSVKVDHDKAYVLSPLSLTRAEGVQPSAITQIVHTSSDVYPGTIRRIWVSVPDQAVLRRLGGAPAAVMVFQDGHAYVNETGRFRAPIVMDNLMQSGQMPPTIGIFIDPGHKAESLPGDKPGWDPKPSNRSLEYDTLSDAYATFLEREILPVVAECEPVQKAMVRLTGDPEWRAICGISSGGICAFTVAWERPDLFRKVVSHVGSFTNIRGGDTYPGIVRRTKDTPKPIRVFLQDGENDLDNQFGNWWLGNLQMQKALAFGGYDHRFVGGVGGHNDKHGAALLPETLAWLWRDWNRQSTSGPRP